MSRLLLRGGGATFAVAAGACAYLYATDAKEAPPRMPVPDGKKRICVVGWPASPHVGRAVKLAREITKQHPEEYETWFFFSFGSNGCLRGEKGDGKGGLYFDVKSEMSQEDQQRLFAHKSVPFCWIESTKKEAGGVVIRGLGGRDNFCEWVNSMPQLMSNPVIREMATTAPVFQEDVLFDRSPGTAQMQNAKANE